MSDNRIIEEWELNRRDRVRVSIEEYKGVPFISVRKWFEAEDGTLRPSKQGITLSLKHLPQLADAINRACAIETEGGANKNRSS